MYTLSYLPNIIPLLCYSQFWLWFSTVVSEPSVCFLLPCNQYFSPSSFHYLCFSFQTKTIPIIHILNSILIPFSSYQPFRVQCWSPIDRRICFTQTATLLHSLPLGFIPLSLSSRLYTPSVHRIILSLIRLSPHYTLFLSFSLLQYTDRLSYHNCT